mmetsp:Transcript_2127/g.2952  ORF Transcript_2127/g.2952 Transcript_2127/m.2952 type:complete len:147 (+) Transcript_2127:227-667(+)
MISTSGSFKEGAYSELDLGATDSAEVVITDNNAANEAKLDANGEAREQQDATYVRKESKRRGSRGVLDRRVLDRLPSTRRGLDRIPSRRGLMDRTPSIRQLHGVSNKKKERSNLEHQRKISTSDNENPKSPHKKQEEAGMSNSPAE